MLPEAVALPLDLFALFLLRRGDGLPVLAPLPSLSFLELLHLSRISDVGHLLAPLAALRIFLPLGDLDDPPLQYLAVGVEHLALLRRRRLRRGRRHLLRLLLRLSLGRRLLLRTDTPRRNRTP